MFLTDVATITQWFNEALAAGATHLLIIRNPLSMDTFPVQVPRGTDPVCRAFDYVCDGDVRYTAEEVYSLNLSLAEQLQLRPAFHVD